MNNLSEEVIAKFLMGKCTEEELIQVNLLTKGRWIWLKRNYIRD